MYGHHYDFFILGAVRNFVYEAFLSKVVQRICVQVRRIKFIVKHFRCFVLILGMIFFNFHIFFKK